MDALNTFVDNTILQIIDLGYHSPRCVVFLSGTDNRITAYISFGVAPNPKYDDETRIYLAGMDLAGLEIDLAAKMPPPLATAQLQKSREKMAEAIELAKEANIAQPIMDQLLLGLKNLSSNQLTSG